MAIKNTSFGGTDWESPSRIKPVDLNDTFDKVAGELSSAVKLIGLNALNILDLTAQSSLTVGINGNFERDIYTDANGYLNTINTTNTNAIFDTNKYYLSPYEITSTTDAVYNTSLKSDNLKIIIMNCSASEDIIISQVRAWTNANDTVTVNIIQNGQTIATSSHNADNNNVKICNFSVTDYSRAILSGQDFQIRITGQFGAIYGTNQSHTGTLFSYSSQDLPAIKNGESDYSGIIATKVNMLTKNTIETNARTIEGGFNRFMIVSNEETTGTGSVSYDITFNSDAETPTYQENLESFKEYSIEEAGTSLILKQNLNTGASSGEASAYNWGVLLW